MKTLHRSSIPPLPLPLWLLAVFALALGGCRGCGEPPSIAKPEENYHLTMDELLLEVAKKVPEFGGMFLDADGVLQVFLLDTGKLADAEKAIAEEFGSEALPEAGVETLQADYGFQQLYNWHRAHRMETLALPGVVSVSIQEMTNRVKVRIESEAARGEVEQSLADQGVPLEAAEIVVSPRFSFYQDSVRDTSRPLIGGQQISRTTGSRCTLGWLAVTNGVAGFVTNSHCQGTQGTFVGTVWHQAAAASDDSGANEVGRESIDPDWVPGGDCPSNKRCRMSDSAFVARTTVDGFAPPTARWDAIALPGNYHNGGMTIDTWVRIRKKQPHAICGQSIQKIGWRTGSTTGTVTDTCCDATGGGGFVVLCQNILEINGAKGDSGAPVFTWSSATLPQGAKPTATLYGILWGGEGNQAAYSPINQVEAELGFLRTNRFEGGANSPPAVEIVNPSDDAVVGMGGLAIETYTAAVSDWEDGDGCCAAAWTSDVDGAMGGGLEVQHAFTTPGSRQVTVTVTDSDGATATDTITVHTSNDSPQVTISAPTSGQTLTVGTPFQLEGSGYDVNEPYQNLPCNLLVWTSSNSGDPMPLTGCIVPVTFGTPGSRTLTLTGTDSGGLQDTASVSINVVTPQAGDPPDVLILNPTGGSAHDGASPVMLRGRVTDTNVSGPFSYQISYEWILQKVGGTTLVGGASQISLGTGQAMSGQQFQTPWTPDDHVLYNAGGTEVRLILRGTDNDGTSTDLVQFLVMFPPA